MFDSTTLGSHDVQARPRAIARWLLVVAALIVAIVAVSPNGNRSAVCCRR
jgi:hypothetical protein